MLTTMMDTEDSLEEIRTTSSEKKITRGFIIAIVLILLGAVGAFYIGFVLSILFRPVINRLWRLRSVSKI